MDQYAGYLTPAQKEQGYAKMNCPPKVRHRTFGGPIHKILITTQLFTPYSTYRRILPFAFRDIFLTDTVEIIRIDFFVFYGFA